MNINTYICDVKNEITFLKSVYMDVFRIKTYAESVIMFILSVLGGFFGYFSILVVENQNAFNSLVLVVGMDWLFGMTLGWRNNDFRINKAVKIIYYLSGYSVILAVVLSVEKSFSYAEWLAEAVMLPIIVFSVIGSLKKASLIGIIPKGVLFKILENIDNYKNDVQSVVQRNNNEQDSADINVEEKQTENEQFE